MKALFRGLIILSVFDKYLLDTLIHLHQLPWYLALCVRLLPWRLFYPVKGTQGQRLHKALESLGPIFIKFGQILSTRKDLLSPELAQELAKLQDKVPPFDSKQAKALIETALGGPIAEFFTDFEDQALASASVAQVHAATLKNGKKVVVKVIRPGIDKIIHQDLALLEVIAHLVNRIPDGRRLRPIEVVEDYRSTVLDELDLMREAANGSALRRNFLDSNLLYVPEVYWDYCRSNVIVMERIYGLPVSDIDTMKTKGVDLELLARRGVEIFFTQVFRDSFFHADMHPGNIFVDIDDPKDPKYIGIDCGIVGTLSDEDQHYLAQNLLAFFNRDYRQVAQLHVESGWVPKNTKVNEFESAIRAVCEPIFDKPLQEISFAQVLLRLFQTARRFNMEVQPQLVLLQKTLLNIEGLGRQLYPQLDLWKTAKPYLEGWMKERFGPKRILKEFKTRGPEWFEKAPYLPDLIFDFVKHAGPAHKALEQQQKEIAELKRANQVKSRSRRRTLYIALLLMAAWLSANPSSLDLSGTWAWPQWLLTSVAGLILIWDLIDSGQEPD